MKFKTANGVYWRKLRNAHYAGAYKGRLRAQGATGDSGALLPRGVLSGSEAARVYLSGNR